MAVVAPAKWAQREDTIFLRFCVADLQDVKVTFEKERIKFSAKDGQKQYENDIPVFKEIDCEKSGYQEKGRSVDCLIYKSNTTEDYWPRLTRDKVKLHWLTVDFSRWRDEDDSEDEGPENFNQDFDFSKMMNNPGGLNHDENALPGEMNLDDLDSDDEEIPGLEDVNTEKKTEEEQETKPEKKQGCCGGC